MRSLSCRHRPRKLLDLLAVPAAEREFAALGGAARQSRADTAAARAGFPALRRAEEEGRQLTIMLVDSHCHLDFPDFAAELDAVVARARAAGIGRMVTISTRVKRHAQVLAIAENFREVFCSVGTHPNHAHEEPDVDAKALIARREASEGRGDRRGGARLSPRHQPA